MGLGEIIALVSSSVKWGEGTYLRSEQARSFTESTQDSAWHGKRSRTRGDGVQRPLWGFRQTTARLRPVGQNPSEQLCRTRPFLLTACRAPCGAAAARWAPLLLFLQQRFSRPQPSLLGSIPGRHWQHRNLLGTTRANSRSLHPKPTM